MLVFIWMAALTLNGASAFLTSGQQKNLSAVESNIVSRIKGTAIYDYDLELEKIALNHDLSLYSFRSSGSVGANATKDWIQQQFESIGLETRAEPFEFTTWNLPAPPTLVVDADGNLATTDDQLTINSFQSAHYSWPTPEGDVFASLVELPVPYAASYKAVGAAHYDAGAWNAVNTTGKVLLIGGEVRWDQNTALAFKNKIISQPPAAIVFANSYDWMAQAPPGFSSSGGRPASQWGAYFWDSKVPVGWVSYGDRKLIQAEMAAQNAFAYLSIPAVIEQGPHYNIVAKLPGSVSPEKEIIISAHYDSVMDAAFCDNGAGTSAVLELAKVFSEATRDGIYKPQYTLVFIAFAGEELGLVGSVNYVKQHASELSNIVAVINLDSLGSEKLEMSKTFRDDNGLDLQGVVMKAANDLGLEYNVTDPGGSDQETFRNPVDTDDVYMLFWNGRSGIRDMPRVKSSIMIDSYPLFYSDSWNGGSPGWIHTGYDSSSSTATLGWVTADRLENQTAVATLSVLLVLSPASSPFLLEIYGSAAIAGGIVLVAAYFERNRLKTASRVLTREVGRHIGPRESLYTIFLTVFFLFLSWAFHQTIRETEVITQGYPTIASIEYAGTPFEMFGFVLAEFNQVSSEGVPQLVQTQAGGIIMLWGGFLANLALFSLLSFLITYAVAKLRYIRAR